MPDIYENLYFHKIIKDNEHIDDGRVRTPGFVYYEPTESYGRNKMLDYIYYTFSELQNKARSFIENLEELTEYNSKENTIDEQLEIYANIMYLNNIPGADAELTNTLDKLNEDFTDNEIVDLLNTFVEAYDNYDEMYQRYKAS